MRRFSASRSILLALAWILGPVGLAVAGPAATTTTTTTRTTTAPAAPAPATRTAGTPAGGGRTVGGGGGPNAAPAPLPPARSVDSILADVVTAAGGAAAMARHHSMHTKMEITFKGLGITGTAEHYAATGDKALTVTEIPNLASTREGSDGTHFWSDDPINGLRLLEGAEAEQARTEVAWNAELRMKELFQKIDVKNERSDDGGYLECLILTPKAGPVITNCFDGKTHLMSLQTGIRSGPQGDMPFTARLSDWRTVGDVKISYATDMQVGPLAFIGRVTAVELDVPLDPTIFDVPKVKSARASKAAGSGKTMTAKPAPISRPARPGKTPAETPVAPAIPKP